MIKPFNAVATMMALLVASIATEASATDAKVKWKGRCSQDLGMSNDAETGSYYFETPGMVAGDKGRASMDYTVRGRAAQTVYPTEAKDLMNKYGGASFSIAYLAQYPAKAPFTPTIKVGRISVSASTANRKPLAGDVKVRLLIDGISFGPYAPKGGVPADGYYSLWFDTAENDGDNAPPVLKPAQFAKIAQAAEAMKNADMLLEQDGKVVVRMPVATYYASQWRTAFVPFATHVRTMVTTEPRSRCPYGSKAVDD